MAAAALEAGATIVNDVAAGADPDMFRVVVDAGAGLVVMHMQGEPRTMQHAPSYDDVVVEVGDFLAARLAAAREAGVDAVSLCADPGIGFGKTGEHNLDAAGAPRASWSTASTCPCSSDRRARRSSPSSLGDDLSRTRTTTARSPTAVWASTRARASCGCTTSARSPTRSGCST